MVIYLISQNFRKAVTCINSMIISSTTDAGQHDNFAEPVEITLSHNTVSNLILLQKIAYF